jgi:hypothetical protein
MKLYRMLTRENGACKLFTTNEPTRPGKPSAHVSRALKRLRLDGTLATVRCHTYKYYLIELGKQVSTADQTLRKLVFMPTLATA